MGQIILGYNCIKNKTILSLRVSISKGSLLLIIEVKIGVVTFSLAKEPVNSTSPDSPHLQAALIRWMPSEVSQFHSR